MHRRFMTACISACAVFVIATLLPSPANGADLWQQLREDRGLVVLMRHTLALGGGDPPGFRLDQCSTQRNLSAEGRKQATFIGRQLRDERIPIAEVFSSRWCRAKHTAKLLGVGDVTPTRALDSVFTVSDSLAARTKSQAMNLMRRHAGKDGVLLLVGHQANIIDLTGVAPQSGEAVVVRISPDGELSVLGELVCATPACTKLRPTTTIE